MGRRGLAPLVVGEACWLVIRDVFTDPFAAVFLLIMGSTLLCSAVSWRSGTNRATLWEDDRFLMAGTRRSRRFMWAKQTGFPTTGEAPHLGTPQTGLACESSLLSGVMVVRAMKGHGGATRGDSDSVPVVEAVAEVS